MLNEDTDGCAILSASLHFTDVNGGSARLDSMDTSDPSLDVHPNGIHGVRTSPFHLELFVRWDMGGADDARWQNGVENIGCSFTWPSVSPSIITAVNPAKDVVGTLELRRICIAFCNKEGASIIVKVDIAYEASSVDKVCWVGDVTWKVMVPVSWSQTW